MYKLMMEEASLKTILGRDLPKDARIVDLVVERLPVRRLVVVFESPEWEQEAYHGSMEHYLSGKRVVRELIKEQD